MITYERASACDIDPIYQLCKQLINDYESLDRIDYDRVLKWVRRKIEISIDEYTAVFVSGENAGYYHFYQNEDGEYEIDDLYIFPEYQSRGIGTAIIQKCCSSVNSSVMLYVFIKNKKAVALYKMLGFEIIRTVDGSRYVMRKENRKYYEAYSEGHLRGHSLRGIFSFQDGTGTPSAKSGNHAAVQKTTGTG